jgi:hypothetical protein
MKWVGSRESFCTFLSFISQKRLPTPDPFVFPVLVGQQERHVVRIEKERAVFLAALGPHTDRMFVDEQYVHEYVG